jgi:hypothetical protein
MTRYYSLYIRHNFVFLALETMGIISFPNFFYEYKLDHLWFPGRFNFFSISLNYYNFLGLWGCVTPESHNSASLFSPLISRLSR